MSKRDKLNKKGEIVNNNNHQIKRIKKEIKPMTFSSIKWWTEENLNRDQNRFWNSQLIIIICTQKLNLGESF